MQTVEINTGVESKSPLESIVDVLEYQKTIKKDIVIPSDMIRYDGLSGLIQAGGFDYALTDHSHLQISDKLEIPRKYYHKMLNEQPDLLASNINTWLSRKEKTKYLLRTFDYGIEGVDNLCRAMLSDRYSILDNYDVLIAALEAIKKTGIHVEIVKAEITERRMYLHVIAPEIHIDATELLDGYLAQETIKTSQLNNGIISGVIITNSEIGMGSFEIAACAQVVKCTNRMHDRAAKFRKVHLGGRLDEGIIDWSQNTKNKNYELIMSQTQDSIKTYLSKDYLGQLTTKLKRYKNEEIVNARGVIEVVSAELGIPENHKESILKHFYKDNDSSAFGMMNSFTRESQKMDADIRYEIDSQVFKMLPQFKNIDNKISKN